MANTEEKDIEKLLEVKPKEKKHEFKKKTPAQRTKAEGGNLTPFTKENAKEMSERGIQARMTRQKMRNSILEAAMKEGIEKYFVKALKSLNPDAMSVVEKAIKIIGVDYASSEDAVQKIKVDATTDNKSDVTAKIEFVLPEQKV